MKKLAVLLLGIAGLASIAATCVIKNIALTEIDGHMHFAAEMENGTTADILNHKYKVAFVNNAGTVVATKTVDGCLRSLQAGTSDFFSADSGKSESQVKAALARIEGPLTFGEVVNGELTFSNVKVTRDGEDIVVAGNVKNTDDDDLENVRVCAVVTDEDDKIIVVARDNNDYDLDKNDSQDFVINLSAPDDVDLSKHVDLWADATNADEGDDVTEPQSKLNNNVEECPTPTKTATPVTNTPTASNTPPATNTATATPTGTLTPANTPTNTPTTQPTAC